MLIFQLQDCSIILLSNYPKITYCPVKGSHSAPNQRPRCFQPSRTVLWQAPQCRFRTHQMSPLLGNIQYHKCASLYEMYVNLGKAVRSSNRTSKTFCNKRKFPTFQQKSIWPRTMKIQQCPVVKKKHLQDGTALYTFINTASTRGLLQNANLTGNCQLKTIRTFC